MSFLNQKIYFFESICDCNDPEIASHTRDFYRCIDHLYEKYPEADNYFHDYIEEYNVDPYVKIKKYLEKNNSSVWIRGLIELTHPETGDKWFMRFLCTMDKSIAIKIRLTSSFLKPKDLPV